MGNCYAPEKKRTSMNWPLRNCCGCIPNPAGMIVLGVLGILSIINLLQLNNPNRKAFMENQCEEGFKNDIVNNLKLVGLVGFIQTILGFICGIALLWTGIIGCQLQGQTMGSVTEGGCCGRGTGKNVGSSGLCLSLTGSFVGIIMYLMFAAMAKNLALATCCQVLSYDMKELNLVKVTVEETTTYHANSKASDSLDMCGFKKDASDFEGIGGDKDNVFMTPEANKNVEESGVKMWFVINGVASLIFTLICCPLCASFIYSATYEISEAGTGATGGATTVGAV